MTRRRPRLACALLGACVLATTAASADVGRLFFSPAERSTLEAARRAVAAPPVEPETVVEPEPLVLEPVPELPALERPAVTVEGFVRRGDGRAVFWVNGENSDDGDLAASLIEARGSQVRGNRVRLVPVDESLPIVLKPGQSWDPATRTITDAYEQGTLTPGFLVP